VPTPVRIGLQRVIDYAIANNNKIAIPVIMNNRAVSDTIMNELASRFGKRNITETLVKRGDEHLRLIDINDSFQNKSKRVPDLSEAKEFDEATGVTAEQPQNVTGESFELAEKAFRDGEISEPLNKWLGLDDLDEAEQNQTIQNHRVRVREIEPLTHSNIQSLKTQLQTKLESLKEAERLDIDFSDEIKTIEAALTDINKAIDVPRFGKRSSVC
jgi:hypothetical protein